LHRYLAEYDFRNSHRAALGVNDNSRAVGAKGISGERLIYRRTRVSGRSEMVRSQRLKHLQSPAIRQTFNVYFSAKNSRSVERFRR